jgi:hypothetical protein
MKPYITLALLFFSASAFCEDIRVTLSWGNRNDLDLHIVTPNDEEIYFHRPSDSAGGILEADMNVKDETTSPVESIFWEAAPEGTYTVYIQNFAFHELSEDATKFKVELKEGGKTQYFEGVVSGEGYESNVVVCTFDFPNGVVVKPVEEPKEKIKPVDIPPEPKKEVVIEEAPPKVEIPNTSRMYNDEGSTSRMRMH